MTFHPNPGMRRALESQGLAVGPRYRCWNCNCLFSERHVIEIGGRFWCRAHCAVCVCGEPATIEDCDGNISCGLCEGSQPDNDISQQQDPAVQGDLRGSNAVGSRLESGRQPGLLGCSDARNQDCNLMGPIHAAVPGWPKRSQPSGSLESLLDIGDYGFLGMLRISIHPPSPCSPATCVLGNGAGKPQTPAPLLSTPERPRASMGALCVTLSAAVAVIIGMWLKVIWG